MSTSVHGCPGSGLHGAPSAELYMAVKTAFAYSSPRRGGTCVIDRAEFGCKFSFYLSPGVETLTRRRVAELAQL